MKFSEEFFQHIRFEKVQIDRFLNRAKKNLAIAKESKHNEVVLHFCYNAIIQLGISAIAEKNYKVRSIPGHHVKLLESMASLLDCPDEIDYLQKIRQKRNIDMYEGGFTLTDKQASDLLHMTENLFKKYTAKNKKSSSSGFTMMELMVSVGITAVLMVGISTFFSSTFRNMFEAREQVSNTQSQFVVSTIVDGKFANVDELQELGPPLAVKKTYAVLRNDMDTGDLPFTFIGTRANGRFDQIVFKDFFVFNGMDISLNSFVDFDANILNPGGLTFLAPYFYVTSPLENRIYRCDPPDNCTGYLDITGVGGLDQPMDLTHDDTHLYVTDAGNNRILQVTDPHLAASPASVVAEGFNYPTGIEHYEWPVQIPPAPSSTEYLFVSDTYNHLVKKVTLTGPDAGTVAVVVGDGDNEDCNNTASFCKLNFPTGLMVHSDELYIADTGNGRVLKMSDPGPPASEGAFERIAFTFDGDVAVGKIEFTDFDNEINEGSSMMDPGSLNGLYSGITHELTLNSIFPTYNGLCPWNNSGSELWTEDDPNPYISDDDLIAIEDGNSGNAVIYEAFNVPIRDSLVCILGEDPAVSHRAYKITLNKNLIGVSTNKLVFRAGISGAEETIDLTFPDISSFDEAGFQAIGIEIFDFDQSTSVETHQHFVRVGDGELGTFEDTIELVSDGYDFPTGLGWSLGALAVSGSPEYSTEFPNYDYISDFDVEKDSIVFDEPNPGNILELNFDAVLGVDDEGDSILESYTLNADI